MNRIDIVTVFHNVTNHAQHEELLESIRHHEPEGGFTFLGVDNRETNRGFAAACNLGAFHPQATAPVIGFLNPDCAVRGPFIAPVTATINDTVVITGCRFNKPDRELTLWGVRDWVCGAVMFVQRPWFTDVGGFDEQFVWSHEETDLIRRAQQNGKLCRSIKLPISHASPDHDNDDDTDYKRFHFAQAQRRFARKWRSH